MREVNRGMLPCSAIRSWTKTVVCNKVYLQCFDYTLVMPEEDCN